MDTRGVSPVIAVVLMVAITVVLASVVYVTVSSLVGSTSSPAPMIFLSQNPSDPGTAKFEVTGTPESTLASRLFSVVLLVNGSIDEASRIDPLEPGTVGNVTYTDYDGKLTIGDKFTVSVVPDTEYELAVIWRTTGDKSFSVSWSEQ
jgi:flagellin-like protein